MVNGHLKNVFRQEIVAQHNHVALYVAVNVMPLRQVMEKTVPVGSVKLPFKQQERKHGLRIPVIRVQGSVKPARLVLMSQAVPGREASVKRMKPACVQQPGAHGYNPRL